MLTRRAFNFGGRNVCPRDKNTRSDESAPINQNWKIYCIVATLRKYLGIKVALREQFPPPGCHRVYARLAELGLPLWLHTGIHLAANRPLAMCTRQHVDRIAVAHPELTLAAGHGGWPWALEGIAAMQRHPNVYTEFSAHRPRITAKPGSGWEPLLLFGRSVLRSRVLFGSAGVA